MGCFSRRKPAKDLDAPAGNQAIATQRKCRDVLFLLIFTVFWGGMFYVAQQAFTKGNPKRLQYGIDSYGNLCGTLNNWNGTGGPDLRNATKLYYLNPLQLLNPLTISTAAAVCVESCPSNTSVCGIGNFPCRNDTLYRCPYYRNAPLSGLYGALPGTPEYSTQYWGQLANTTLPAAQCGIGALSSFPQRLRSAFLSDTSSPVCGQYLQFTSQYPGKGPCYPVLVETVEYFNRCFPKFDEALVSSLVNAATGQSASSNSTSSTSYSSAFNSAGQRLQRYIADIYKGILIIVAAGLAGGVVISLIWMVILRYFAGFMTWAAVLACNLLFCLCTLLCFMKAGVFGTDHFFALGTYIHAQLPVSEDPSVQDRHTWLIVGYVLAGLTAILVLFTLVMMRRIKVAVACIKISSQAVSCMPSILFFPILPFTMLVCLIVYWVSVAGYLYSAGTIMPKYASTSSVQLLSIGALYDGASNSSGATPPPPPPPASNQTNFTDADCANNPNCYYAISWDKQLEYLFIYHFFGLLWTNQFIVGFGYVVIAGAISHFYWTRGDRRLMPRAPVLLAIGNTIRYHLGSIALGSFIVAVIQFIRYLLAYIDKQSKKLQQRAGPAGWIIKCLLRCAQCCMWLLDKIMQFINRNAYIMVAVHGTGYCTSAFHAVKLLVMNALRVVAVNVVGDALIFLGKLSVCAACGVIAFLMSNLSYYTNPDKYPETYLSSPLLPIILSALVAFCVAQMFFSVYEMAIDTILLSFCEDSESHGGVPQYAPPMLLQAIGQAKLAKQQKAEKKAAEAESYTDRVGKKGAKAGKQQQQGQFIMASSNSVPALASS